MIASSISCQSKCRSLQFFLLCSVQLRIKMMQMRQVSDLYSPKEQWASYVINAIKAKELHSKNVNYIVRNKKVSSNRATCKQSCWAGSFCLFLPKSMAPSRCPSTPLAFPLNSCNLVRFPLLSGNASQHP